jgi:hypothetical protein
MSENALAHLDLAEIMAGFKPLFKQNKESQSILLYAKLSN